MPTCLLIDIFLQFIAHAISRTHYNAHCRRALLSLVSFLCLFQFIYCIFLLFASFRARCTQCMGPVRPAQSTCLHCPVCVCVSVARPFVILPFEEWAPMPPITQAFFRSTTTRTPHIIAHSAAQYKMLRLAANVIWIRTQCTHCRKRFFCCRVFTCCCLFVFPKRVNEKEMQKRERNYRDVSRFAFGSWNTKQKNGQTKNNMVSVYVILHRPWMRPMTKRARPTATDIRSVLARSTGMVCCFVLSHEGTAYKVTKQQQQNNTQK